MSDPIEEETKAAQEATQPYRQQINETPALQSLLYDIDLLPEQIRIFVNVTRMIAFCELFKLVPPEAIEKAFGPDEGDLDPRTPQYGVAP